MSYVLQRRDLIFGILAGMAARVLIMTANNYASASDRWSATRANARVSNY